MSRRMRPRSDLRAIPMTTEGTDDAYSEQEAKRRFEAALRGALIAAPMPMKDISSEADDPKGTSSGLRRLSRKPRD